MSDPAQHVADGAKRQNMNQTTTVSLSLLGSPSLDQRKNHQLPTDDLDDEQLRLAERAWDYERGRRLGSGSFGTVYQCRNRKTGKLMAVKVLQEHTGRKYEREKWKREVTNMNKATHTNVVKCLGSRGWNGSQVEIFLELQTESLHSLITEDCDQRFVESTLELVVDHMLHALKHLDDKGIYHRDLKPENILYTINADDQFVFRLADFGLSNSNTNAKSLVGTPLYRAPELSRRGSQKGKGKMDVWSLLVTMAWILDIRKFRTAGGSEEPPEEQHGQLVSDVSFDARLRKYTAMAFIEPEDRASAGMMLEILGRPSDTDTKNIAEEQYPAISVATPHPGLHGAAEGYSTHNDVFASETLSREIEMMEQPGPLPDTGATSVREETSPATPPEVPVTRKRAREGEMTKDAGKKARTDSQS